MRFFILAGFASLLASCQPIPTSITIYADGQVYSRNDNNRVPDALLTAAWIKPGPDDRILVLGSTVPHDVALPEAISYTLIVRRAVTLTLNGPNGQSTIHTSAQTVGQALTEAGFVLYSSDRIDPPPETPISGNLAVTYQPGRNIVVTVDGNQVKIRSSATTVGQALAEAGVPLVGLDFSQPGGLSPVPEDGQIRIVRVVESITLNQKSIPYNSRSELSADLEIDQQALLQGGEPGLAITRVRTRTEDGVQVSQLNEGQSVVRPSQDRIMGFGTKIVIRTATVDGVTFDYYRALTLKVTSYSPCQSLDPHGLCRYGTSSGRRVQKGVVAMVYSWYLLFGNDTIFVPGYGKAVVADVGGGWPAGNHFWVDLGWSDEDFQPLTYENGITVYFLTPVPTNPGYILP